MITNMKNNLKKILLNKKINQQELANNTHLTKSAISNYVNGKRKPNGQNMLKIAKILNCKVEDIWELEK